MLYKGLCLTQFHLRCHAVMKRDTDTLLYGPFRSTLPRGSQRNVLYYFVRVNSR